jgi:hypothetical protein
LAGGFSKKNPKTKTKNNQNRESSSRVVWSGLLRSLSKEGGGSCGEVSTAMLDGIYSKHGILEGRASLVAG